MFQSFIGVDFWTALAVLINTLLLYYVLKKFLFVPVMKMIEERRRRSTECTWMPPMPGKMP